MSNATQIFTNATTGNSSTFNDPKGQYTYRLAIDGTSSTAINAYAFSDPLTRNLDIKIRGITDAPVNLQCKLADDDNDDSFSNTGDTFTADDASTIYYK